MSSAKITSSSRRTYASFALGLLCLVVTSCKAPPPPPAIAPASEEIVGLAPYWQKPLPRVESKVAEATTYVHATRDAWLHRLSPTLPALATDSRPAPTRVSEHLEILRAHTAHQKHYWSEPLHAAPEAQRIIWLIPQYHRSSEFPEVWSSLGAEIAQVQNNIDLLITTLHHQHGLSCIGIEGQSAKRLPRSRVLDQAARWVETLAHHFHRARTQSGASDPRIQPTMDAALRTLQPYLSRYVQLLDGAGMAVHRLTPRDITGPNYTPPIMRFGLEDSKLNQRAVELLAQIREREKRLILPPTSESPGESEAEQALRTLWLDEFPSFDSETLTPLSQAIDLLSSVSQELKRDGLTSDADELNQFTRQLRLMVQTILRPADITAYHTHYQAMATTPAPTPESAETLAADHASHNATLEAELDVLRQSYTDVAHTEREAHAIARTLEMLSQGSHQSCAIVMGAGHLRSLEKRLRDALPADTAIIVVRPFAHPI